MSHEFDGDCFPDLPTELAQIENQLFAIAVSHRNHTFNLELMYQCGWSAAIATYPQSKTQRSVIDTVPDPARRTPLE